MMKRLIVFLTALFILLNGNKDLAAQTGYAPLTYVVNEDNPAETADSIYALLIRTPSYILQHHGQAVKQDIIGFLQQAMNIRPLSQTPNQNPLAAPRVIYEAPPELVFEFQGLRTPNASGLNIQTGLLYLTTPNNYGNLISISQSRLLINTRYARNALLLFSVFDTNDNRGRIQVIIIGEKNIMKTNNSN